MEHTPAKSFARVRLVEKIRSELNIEKWPAIWQPAKSKNKPSLRVMERETTAPDGNRIVSRVEIGYTHLGTLTTEEQKMLYVLIKLWEDNGKPDKQVFFSSRGLARMLKKKGWGTNVIDAITKSLRKLRTIPIEWINSYYDQTRQGASVVDRRPLTLLGDLRVIERRQDGAVNSSQGYFKFDDHMLTNLHLNYTKPVCIEEFFKLRSEIAQLIYSHIDLMLFDKSRYERRSRELFSDLGLKNAEYEHMYERRRAIERAVKELEGIRLSSGVLKSAVIEKTNDGKDYKVSFSKSAAPRLEVRALEDVKESAASVTINHYQEKNPLLMQAEELVVHFHRTFHGVQNHDPQSKETGQALSLITQHGIDAARHIVEFAHAAAAASGFALQTFGGILQYTSRGATDYDRTRQRQAESAERLVVRPLAVTDVNVLVRGECRFEALTPEQRDDRLEAAKTSLCRQSPALARMIAKQNSSITESLIRSRMLRQLDEEPMDLMPLNYLPDWSKRPTQNFEL